MNSRIGMTLAWLVRAFTLFASLFALIGLGAAAHAAPVSIKVVSARTEPQAFNGAGVTKGAAVTTYKYIINIDNTGQTTQRSPAPGTGCSPQDAGYPNSCLWTSIGGTKGSAPVYMQGDQSDFGAATKNIIDGRYLISVLADGYKLDGRHFTVSGSQTASPTVTWEGKAATDPATEVKVELQPTPLPDAQIQAAVFEDVSPVNSAPDLPAEHGLAGFQGHILDYLGEVTTNVYGTPLCETGRCLSACYVVSNGLDVGAVQPIDAAGRCPSDTLPTTMTQCPGGKAPYVVTVSPTAPFNTFQCYGGATPSVVPMDAGGAIEGKVKIPNLGPNRYTLSVTPPDGSGWIQTTTLEGNHDWDAWVMEGATGLDTEFIAGGEPFPAIIFGYIPAPGTPSAVGSALPAALTGTGSITGVVEGVKIYVPTTGGVAGLPGEIWGGLQGAKLDKPVAFPWVTLTNLGNGDTVVWAGKGDANGKFTIPNVPAGTYTLTWWDEPQNTILDLVNITIKDGETVDMGILPLAGWWTFFDGYVFNDTNRNGIKDPGEPGISGYTLTMRKRENSLMDRGTTVTTTDADGYYKFEAGYPMTQWLVMEAYDDLHYSTGITYQADNQPTPTTLIGGGVDVSVHPIIGLSGHMDWGKHIYDATGAPGSLDPQNGGIVGTVSYDTTRNELDPRYAAVEDWQPSIPDLTVKLYLPKAATPGCIRLTVTGSNAATANCDATGRYALDPTTKAFATDQLLNTYVTETWKRPNGCIARDLDGAPLVHGTSEQVLPLDDSKECIEAPLMGVQFWGGDPANAEFPGVEVNGNYGFGDGCFAPNHLDPTAPADAPVCLDTNNVDVGFTPLTGGLDYLVQVDLTSQKDALGRNVYKVTREEDINIGNGDDFVPAVPPSACAGALHTVNTYTTLPVFNPNYPGVNPYEGQKKPLCDTKLIRLDNGKSIAPAFNLYTDVPIPGRHWFIIIDDLNFSSDPKSVTYGEKAGMPFVPVGIYDYTDRLIKTVESDYNGLVDVLLPSTNRINCPTPSGVCGNLYRYVGNDPGVPGRLNTNFNPLFRTIAAEFEVLPGLIVPSDLAPTQVGVSVQLPGGQVTSPVQCKLEDTTPQIYAVSRPYVSGATGNALRSFTIKGLGFGASGTLYLSTRGVANPTALTTANGGITSWTNTQINVTVPTTVAVGPKQLSITAANGQSTINGLTLHVLGTGYSPTIYEVSPTVVDATLPAAQRFVPTESLPAAADHAIQKALDAAAVNGLVVVYPNKNTALTNPRQNPRGAYYENLIITKSVKLQGVGPGSPDGSVPGSIIDGAAFAGDSPVATDWYTRIASTTSTPPMVNANNGNATPTWGGNATIYDGAVISLYMQSSGTYALPNSYAALSAPVIDGFDLRGGDQQGFPGNINAIGGAPTGLPAGLVTQGGAIFANAYARQLQITNNVVQNNGGAYGTIRIGTPDLPDPNNHNEGVVIAYNRVIQNAGTNQAGGIGIFGGADNYQVVSNDICGNFSSEYGGGLSAVGYSPNGTITKNRIYFNRSFDEGGGIMIAGALPSNPNRLSPGSGPVVISGNLIQANLANDDGGGLRFLMAGNYPIDVFNNFIVNNISTHEGGGVAINDTPNIRFYNNTVMKNLTTDTAVTALANTAAPAGLATSLNSVLMQRCTTANTSVCSGQPPQPLNPSAFSNPLLFNNIFWDNRAGKRNASAVTGLSATDADYWDLGVADGVAGQVLAPTNSVVQQNSTTHPYTTNANNKTTNPAVLSGNYDVGVTFNTWRNNPAFLGAIMISADLPPTLMGNYHITTASPAYNAGAANKSGVNAPTTDIDGNGRPGFGPALIDIGADEVPAANADLGITITDGVTNIARSQALTYTIVVTNAGPDAVTGATVTNTLPATLTGATWTCTGAAGNCSAASGTGNIATTVSLASGGSLTFTVKATVSATAAAGNLANTATVAAPVGTNDVTNTANNTATDTDTVVTAPALPTLTVLDAFNRANATTLGTSWSQTSAVVTVVRLNTNRAGCDGVAANCLDGTAMWNGTGNVFGAKQGAALTFINATPSFSYLYLKASGGTASAPSSFIRVYPAINDVVVDYTTNSGATFTQLARLTGANYRTGDVMTAVVNSTGTGVAGTVDVWRTTGTVTTYLGRSAAAPAAFATGTGRIGMRLLNGAQVDNFSGGTVP